MGVSNLNDLAHRRIETREGRHAVLEAAEKIRVLIVDDVPETRENLRKLLSFDAQIEVVGAAASGEESIVLAKEFQPDIVIMDINLPGMDGIAATEAIVREVPTAQIIVLSVQGETDYLRRAMLAGARDFLTKPASGDELMTTIRRVYETGQVRAATLPFVQPGVPEAPTAGVTWPRRGGQVIAVFAPKGGVGCTTLAVNLAIALQQRGGAVQKVVLVDASLQFGDVGVMLNLQAARSIADLASQMDNLDSDMLGSVLTPHSSGVKVLLAPPRPEMADLIGAAGMRRVLDLLCQEFAWVIVDTQSQLHDVVLTVFDIAELILLVANPDIPALKNARLFFELADALDYSPQKTVLILNKTDRHWGIRAEDIERTMKRPVVAQIPLDERVAVMAVNRGVPFVIHDQARPISQSVFQLAEYVQMTLAKAEEKVTAAGAAVEEEERHGLLRRVLR